MTVHAWIETNRGGDAVEVTTHGMLGALDTTIVPRAQLMLHSQSDDYYMFKIMFKMCLRRNLIVHVHDCQG